MTQALDRFLAAHEKRALVIAQLATGDREEALDIVQDSMLAFVRRYASKPDGEWPPLFHRVLQNRIRDWHRRRQVRRGLFGLLHRFDRGDGTATDPFERIADRASQAPDRQAAADAATQRLVEAVGSLPERQRQAFLLRIWEGLDVAATAGAMGCSDGSVKTHLARALANLRAQLEDHHDD